MRNGRLTPRGGKCGLSFAEIGREFVIAAASGTRREIRRERPLAYACLRAIGTGRRHIYLTDRVSFGPSSHDLLRQGTN
jgi:hypothetical protein